VSNVIGTWKKCIKNIGRKTWKKIPLGRSRHRWEDNIKMDVGEIGWEGVDWIHLDQERVQWRAVVKHGN
jgi:hypothetical protein